uniref:SET domain-containing protein n=1 Tax=Corethron hystrix TaxID=216773 RepID=A0A7S1B6U4_9STRA
MCTTYRPRLFSWRANSYKSTVVHKDDVKGRTLKATKFIPAGTFLNVDDPATSFYIDKNEWDLLDEFVKINPSAEFYSKLQNYINEYGYESSSTARVGRTVSVANVNTFINHGCSKEQFKVGALLKRTDENYVNFSPLTTRHSELLINSLVVLQDIEEGEEILQDYSEFWDDEKASEFDEFHKRVCGAN